MDMHGVTYTPMLLHIYLHIHTNKYTYLTCFVASQHEMMLSNVHSLLVVRMEGVAFLIHTIQLCLNIQRGLKHEALIVFYYMMTVH